MAVSGASKVRAKMTGPKFTRLHLLLQRSNDFVTNRVRQVIRRGDDEIKRFDLFANKIINPIK